MVKPSEAEPAATLLDLARARPARLGAGRLICIDGPAGSGKTSLGRAVAALAPRAHLIHLDDLYDGWDGLPRLSLLGLLEPLAQGTPGRYRRYDWAAGRYDATVEVQPTPLLVIDGVGSGARAHAHLISALAWVEAPAELCLERGLARDGADLRSQWTRWQAAESAHFEREGTRTRADLVVDTGTGRGRVTPAGP